MIQTLSLAMAVTGIVRLSPVGNVPMVSLVGGCPCVVTGQCSRMLEKNAMTSICRAVMDAAKAARLKMAGSAKSLAVFLRRADAGAASSIPCAELPLARQHTTIPVRALARPSGGDAYGTEAAISACANLGMWTMCQARTEG